MENAYSADLIVGGSLKVRQSGIEFAIRLPWYRALPLSVVEIASLKLDGKAVAVEQVRFEINGKSFALADLPAQVQEFWFVLDDAHLCLSGEYSRPGTEHRLELQVNLYPPYIPHLTWVTQASRTMRAVGGDEAQR